MKKYRVKVYREYDTFDPRADYDHLGTMACWHGRYTLGDEQPSDEPLDHQLSLIPNNGKLEDRVAALWSYDNPLPYKGARDAVAALVGAEWDKHFISLPLYLYDHSGLTMSTGSFSCPWDSGQVGFIYVSKKDVREEWGWKVITTKRQEQILDVLRGEVEEYDAYLRGDVWGFHIEELVEEEHQCEHCNHVTPDSWDDTGDGCGGIFNINDCLVETILAEIGPDYGITREDVEQAIEDAIC